MPHTDKIREDLQAKEKRYRELSKCYFGTSRSGSPYQCENEYYRGKADGILEALKAYQE